VKQPDLILFAKQPLPGQVKTRLQCDYRPDQVVEIARFLLTATVELAVSSWPSSVYLYAAPDPEHPVFRALAAQFHLELAAQAVGSLGQRMRAALQEGIARRGAAAIMGCDVPHCPWEVVEQAHELLAAGANVLGPTEDGGYYLIGLQQAPALLFEDIPWGGREVTQITLARARALGLAFELLPALVDIDTQESLWTVAQGYEPLRKLLYKVLASA
jgi:rSAM/selenodomain-associated transferase 1